MKFCGFSSRWEGILKLFILLFSCWLNGSKWLYTGPVFAVLLVGRLNKLAHTVFDNTSHLIFMANPASSAKLCDK